jgi:3-phosphoshikimate 1-carboxyvinyltransferase
MLRVVEPLRQMGALIDGRQQGALAPLAVRGGALKGVEVDTEVASAQVKSALLLAGLKASGRTVVREPAPSRDHTERMLTAAGIRLSAEPGMVALEGGQEPAARRWKVPGDLSAALYLLVAGLLVPGSDITVEGVGLNPTRAAALGVLQRMGADLRVVVEGSEGGEPVGSIQARSSPLQATAIRPDEIAALIDDLPLLAVAATQARGETTIAGAADLRVKESDRIATMAAGLGPLGGRVEELPDGLRIEGPTPLGGGVVSSAGDHRVAMSLAVAGLVAGSRVRIRGWRCVDTSWPGFLQALAAAQGEG